MSTEWRVSSHPFIKARSKIVPGLLLLRGTPLGVKCENKEVTGKSALKM